MKRTTGADSTALSMAALVSVERSRSCRFRGVKHGVRD